MTGNKHWLVNFATMDCLHHGICNKLWMMGYQYVRRGEDEPARKAAITRNWKRLGEFSPGDKFVAYVPGNKYFATGAVINPRRQCKPTDKVDSIESYLKRGKSYTKGFVYFPPSVTYETSLTTSAITVTSRCTVLGEFCSEWRDNILARITSSQDSVRSN